VSNHHLGTLVGLLVAAYEMNVFKSDYQKSVIMNAKAFARFLKEKGLAVEGDPKIGYTETHQVIVRVGYGKGRLMAERLEEITSSLTIRVHRMMKPLRQPVA
jgi:aminomethyltransferase